MSQALTQIAIALPPAVLARLDEEANRRTVQRGLLVRQLVLDFLARGCPPLETPSATGLATDAP